MKKVKSVVVHYEDGTHEEVKNTLPDREVQTFKASHEDFRVSDYYTYTARDSSNTMDWSLSRCDTQMVLDWGNTSTGNAGISPTYTFTSTLNR